MEPASSQDGPLGVHIPFIASTFSHACPTRAPGDQTRMHSVLSAFFHGPVSGEERRRRVVQRLTCMFDSSFVLGVLRRSVLAEALMNKDPLQYVLPVEQMIENDYPVPTYMADVFQYTPKWRETPKPDNPLVAKNGMPVRKIYAIDCEMVRRMSLRV